VQLAHDVTLSLAAGARAGAAQFLQGDEILRTIVPLDGQFLADLLQVHGPHDPILDRAAAEGNDKLKPGCFPCAGGRDLIIAFDTEPGFRLILGKSRRIERRIEE
jgi:hypothetical protein